MNISFRFLNQFTQSPNGMLWDLEGDAGAAPTSAASAPAAATPAAPTQSAPATPSAPSQPPATGGHEAMVPSYRIRETREAAIREAQTQFEQRERNYQSQLDRVQQQLHALVGVTPPQNPEVQQVRDQFASLYPGLSKLEERAQQLQDLVERAGDLESQNSHYWQSYGRQTMDSLFKQAESSLGAPLTDEGKRSLHSSFVGFVQSSPELTNRYANDPTIVNDFWKAFTSNFIDPTRRAAGANVGVRAAGNIPQDVPAGVPQVAGAPKPANLDERAASAWALYNHNAKQ